MFSGKTAIVGPAGAPPSRLQPHSEDHCRPWQLAQGMAATAFLTSVQAPACQPNVAGKKPRAFVVLSQSTRGGPSVSQPVILPAYVREATHEPLTQPIG